MTNSMIDVSDNAAVFADRKLIKEVRELLDWELESDPLSIRYGFSADAARRIVNLAKGNN
jgi:hypothetical protein